MYYSVPSFYPKETQELSAPAAFQISAASNQRTIKALFENFAFSAFLGLFGGHGFLFSSSSITTYLAKPCQETSKAPQMSFRKLANTTTRSIYFNLRLSDELQLSLLDIGTYFNIKSSTRSCMRYVKNRRAFVIRYGIYQVFQKPREVLFCLLYTSADLQNLFE